MRKTDFQKTGSAKLAGSWMLLLLRYDVRFTLFSQHSQENGQLRGVTLNSSIKAHTSVTGKTRDSYSAPKQGQKD